MSGRFYYYGGGGTSPAAPEPIACDPTLEVKDAVVIEEIDRENRSDNNRKNS